MEKLASELQPGELFWTQSGGRYRATGVRVSYYGTVRVDVGIGEVMFGAGSKVTVHE